MGEDEIKAEDVEVLSNKKESTKEFRDHIRRTHRLQTARITIYGGGIALVSLCGAAFFTPNNPSVINIIEDAITLIGTIITLALGFIAGSNIE